MGIAQTYMLAAAEGKEAECSAALAGHGGHDTSPPRPQGRDHRRGLKEPVTVAVPDDPPDGSTCSFIASL
jgi:hypothetical protein